jgi:hypothetical protein
MAELFGPIAKTGWSRLAAASYKNRGCSLCSVTIIIPGASHFGSTKNGHHPAFSNCRLAGGKCGLRAKLRHHPLLHPWHTSTVCEAPQFQVQV